LIVERFQQIARICGNRVESFDVVNEPSRIYDVHMRDRRSGRAHIVPEDDYCVELFRLARELFPAAKLILNDVTGAVFSEFRGKYSGYYLLLKDLLSRGVPIDEIGFQCHIAGGPEQAYNTEILCDILDTYATLGKPINISEISIASEFEGETDEELQALAAERLYQTCFSHPAVTGITWWNLPDDGVLTTKRVAAGENLPSTGLLDGDYREKPAYQRLQQLITQEWRTDCHVDAPDGVAKFRGFYGTYCLTVTHGAHRYEVPITLTRDASRVQTVQIRTQ
jgi:endo-1,4-beta-xylanase